MTTPDVHATSDAPTAHPVAPAAPAPCPDTLPGMPAPVDAAERPATYGEGERHERAPLFNAPKTIRGQLPMDTDSIGQLGAWRNDQ